MNKLRVTYFALVALLSAVSCTKEAVEPGVYDWTDGKIYFKTSLADVASSRAMDVTLDHLESFQVTCFNTGDITTDEQGVVAPYFEDATFIRQENSVLPTYISSPFEEPRDWPDKEGVIEFFAFSPSLSVMAAKNSALTADDTSKYFNLLNTSTESNSTVKADYRLGVIRTNPDISRQFDFLTAQVSGERWRDFTGGVELAFSHKLCQVELKAWGADSGYDFEIAGVRIGNPVVEGTYVFADGNTADNADRWQIPDDPIKDKVEYLYRGAGESPAEDNQNVSDKLFRINSLEHNTAQSAGSIMGQGGCAMLLPTVNTRWEGLMDPNINTSSYTTDKMYFSILLRVTDSVNGNSLYPYSGNVNGMNVVYYAVDQSDTIIARVYPDEKEGTYFTDSDLQTPFTVAEGIEIKDFGWAAVPVDADWRPGNRYVYTLNYSEGIGMHDPADPEPGKIIVGTSPIEWSVSVGGWDYAEKDENYTPDLDVP